MAETDELICFEAISCGYDTDCTDHITVSSRMKSSSGHHHQETGSTFALGPAAGICHHRHSLLKDLPRPKKAEVHLRTGHVNVYTTMAVYMITFCYSILSAELTLRGGCTGKDCWQRSRSIKPAETR